VIVVHSQYKEDNEIDNDKLISVLNSIEFTLVKLDNRITSLEINANKDSNRPKPMQMIDQDGNIVYY